ncbi:MAG: hypothetical protein LBQ81_00015 [Zoogloeaceae bacterium]|jgi:hypothetical protein|nr:hypothetical protein [Zoogloeaceae bacterium]
MNGHEHDEEYPQDPQLSVAATLHLLSMVGLHGANAARCSALLRHLERLFQDECLAEPLRQTCVQLYSSWRRVLRSIQRVDQNPVAAHWIESFDALPPTANGRVLH